MRLINRRFIAGFLAGVLFATVVILSHAALAAFMKKNWDKQGWKFQAGYVSGFTDCIRINRGYDPTDYIRRTYPLPANTTPLEWLRGINKFYREKGNEERSIYQAIAVVGGRLVAKHGPLKDPDPRERAKRLMEAARKKKESASKEASDSDHAGASAGDKADAKSADSDQKRSKEDADPEHSKKNADPERSKKEKSKGGPSHGGKDRK